MKPSSSYSQSATSSGYEETMRTGNRVVQEIARSVLDALAATDR